MRCQITDKIIAHIGGTARVFPETPITQSDAARST
jgi:hypothetical protein